MPELPDLEGLVHFVNTRLKGVRVVNAEAPIGVVVRNPTPHAFADLLAGSAFKEARRKGKFLLLEIDGGHVLAINFMLTGRLQYCDPKARRFPRTCFVLSLDNGRELRYFDDKVMGKVYLVAQGALESIPTFSEMGPDALSPELTLELFWRLLNRRSAALKDILTNQKFIAGIGNAYADEVLFDAGLYPFRRRTTLRREEIVNLHHSVGHVLREASATIKARLGDDIHVEIRDFLKVHRRGGEPCPRCEHTISEISPGGRTTSFCRACQV